MEIKTDAWNYFIDDPAYADELSRRLFDGVEMNSALGMARIIESHLSGDLRIIDFGSGPGHYYPVIKRIYSKGDVQYHGVDITPSSVKTGNDYFLNDQNVQFSIGSVLEPSVVYSGEECVISANTLSHVPSIEPLLAFISKTPSIRVFIFRMLVGGECIQTKKHLRQGDYETMFEQHYQYNNIYSEDYLRWCLNSDWHLEIIEDYNNTKHLDSHRLPHQDVDEFYGNRVSRERSGMVFKGDLYMPWRYVVGRKVC